MPLHNEPLDPMEILAELERQFPNELRIAMFTVYTRVLEQRLEQKEHQMEGNLND